jgi:hypothetical protein
LGHLEFIPDALSAQAQAINQGLILAQTIGCNRVIITSDCMDAIMVMNDGGNSSGVAAAVFAGCYHSSKRFYQPALAR